MTLPNFIVIGARKAGTTSLYHYLEQHPEVFMSPVKETNFFVLEGGKAGYSGPDADTRVNRWSVADPEEYEKLFEDAGTARAIGEASPAYLCDPSAPARIKRRIPGARLVAVLRDPAERAYSAYMHQVRDGREMLPFPEALDAEEWRTQENWAPAWFYRFEGFYRAGLSRYLELFGPDLLKIYLYEDLRDDPRGTLRDLYRFLKVDDGFVPDVSERSNVSGVPKSRLLASTLKRPNPLREALKPLLPKAARRRLSKRLRNLNLSPAPPMPPDARRRLVESYREDVMWVQDLIGRDLSAWLR